jgi:hypothetical protein
MHLTSRAIAALATSAVVLGQPAEPARLGERVRTLTRDSAWTEAERIPMTFPTFHPQGMVKIGDTLFVSSVEIRVPTKRYATPRGGHDRDTGQGAGHLFKVDLRPGRAGTLLGSVTLGDGTMYHPGGLDFDGTWIWVPVAEYRPDSRSLVYRIHPDTLEATAVLRVADHIGGVVHDTDGRALHGVSWGSRRFYRWRLEADGTVDPASARTPSVRPNPSHYVDYQDCHYAGRGTMLCGGVGEVRSGPGGSRLRLGGLDLVDLADGRPLHQVPVPLWTSGGLPMTQNPVWLETADGGLRAYFMPEDDRSVLYVYDVAKNSGAAR